jgi:hypothetical protein
MENERNNKPVPAQWLHLLNSSHIQRKLEQGPKLKAIFDSGRKPQEIATELYLTILSRYPTPDELKYLDTLGQVQPAKPPPPATNTTAKTAGKAGAVTNAVKPVTAPANVVVKKREDWVDIAWALINSSEFLYRH